MSVVVHHVCGWSLQDTPIINITWSGGQGWLPINWSSRIEGKAQMSVKNFCAYYLSPLSRTGPWAAEVVTVVSEHKCRLLIPENLTNSMENCSVVAFFHFSTDHLLFIMPCIVWSYLFLQLPSDFCDTANEVDMSAEEVSTLCKFFTSAGM